MKSSPLALREPRVGDTLRVSNVLHLGHRHVHVIKPRGKVVAENPVLRDRREVLYGLNRGEAHKFFATHRTLISALTLSRKTSSTHGGEALSSTAASIGIAAVGASMQYVTRTCVRRPFEPLSQASAAVRLRAGVIYEVSACDLYLLGPKEDCDSACRLVD